MKSKVLIITGGFGTLGKAVAEMAIAQGASIALIDVAAEPANLSAMLQGPDVARYPGVDLQDPSAAEKVVSDISARFGQVDALANVAGGFTWQTLESGNISTWDALYGQNVRTAVNMSRAVIPYMLRQSAGAIVNVGANAAQKAGAGMGAYAASKAGVHRLTEALAEEVKLSQVRVNAVLPSILDTPANRADMPEADFTAWVSPADLARVILFLCSDEAKAITGVLLPVTGRV